MSASSGMWTGSQHQTTTPHSPDPRNGGGTGWGGCLDNPPRLCHHQGQCVQQLCLLIRLDAVGGPCTLIYCLICGVQSCTLPINMVHIYRYTPYWLHTGDVMFTAVWCASVPISEGSMPSASHSMLHRVPTPSRWPDGTDVLSGWPWCKAAMALLACHLCRDGVL